MASSTTVDKTTWPFPFSQQEWDQTPFVVQDHVLALQNQLHELQNQHHQLQQQVDILQGRVDQTSKPLVSRRRPTRLSLSGAIS